jgi:protein TonB
MTAIIIVAILHALLGYAFITGLAYNVIKQVAKDLKTFDVEEAPPPDEEPPPPPEKQEVQPPPVAPPPIVQALPAPASPPLQTVPRPPTITPPAPPAPPAPPRIEPAKAKANLGSYISNEDYPAAALRAEESGTTRFRLTVGPDGRVTDCAITSSSGSSALDGTTCRLMKSRARFTPATDSSGNRVSDTVPGTIKWVLPAD